MFFMAVCYNESLVEVPHKRENHQELYFMDTQPTPIKTRMFTTVERYNGQVFKCILLECNCKGMLILPASSLTIIRLLRATCFQYYTTARVFVRIVNA